MDDGGLLGARLDGGVQIRPPNYEKSSCVERVVISVPYCKERAYWDFLKAQIGKPYDKLAIVSFAVNRNWRETDAWFCNELVAVGLEQAEVVRKLAPCVNRLSRKKAPGKFWGVEKARRQESQPGKGYRGDIGVVCAKLNTFIDLLGVEVRFHPYPPGEPTSSNLPKVDRHFLRPWRRARPSRNAILEVPLIGGRGGVAVFISRTIRPSRNATSVRSPVGTPSCRSFFSRTVLSAFAFARSCSVAAASLTTAPRLRSFR
jgi:hypothetical protein